MDQTQLILRELSRQGFTYRLTSKCHYAIYSPQGWLLTTLAGTGGKGRGHRNGIATLRRAGFEWKGR